MTLGRPLDFIAWSGQFEDLQRDEARMRIVVPMIGGRVSSTLLTLIVIPAVWELVEGWRLPPTPPLEHRR